MSRPDPLYPPLGALRRQQLSAGPGHRLSVVESGASDGFPALFLHGGPGSQCSSLHARVFDPTRFRLIMPDQRGCGDSTPQGGIDDNTTAALVDDIERLRAHCGVDRWLVYGGSWGGTLALEYAKRHPERISALVLRAPFLARAEDLDWFVARDGVARELPAAYRELRERLQAHDDNDLIELLYRAVLGQSASLSAAAAASAWDRWESAVMGLHCAPADEAAKEASVNSARINGKRIYAHYCHHRFWLGSDGVLRGLRALKHTPGSIVHGTQDRVCRPQGSQLLVSECLPAMSLNLVEGAGHAMTSTALQTALRCALDAWADALTTNRGDRYPPLPQ